MGLIPDEIDITTVISINARNDLREVRIHMHGPEEGNDEELEVDEKDSPCNE